MLATSLLLWTATAGAQDWSGAPREPQRRSTDHSIIGIGLAQVPTYQGSDSYRTLPLPAIDVAVGPYYFNLRNGVGINVIDLPVLTFGGGIAFMPGYRQEDVPTGVNRLKAGVGARMFMNFNTGVAIVSLGGTRGLIGSTKGFIADASVAYPIIAGRRLALIPSIGTTWANGKHNDRYFGIDAGESAASGLREFHAGSGFKDISTMVTANYSLTGRINLTASAGLTTLLGDVRDSPLIAHTTQPTGFLSLSYRLGR
ncbi:MAG TPA: MipA/OmpV family protein [Sphingobium sp.]